MWHWISIAVLLAACTSGSNPAQPDAPSTDAPEPEPDGVQIVAAPVENPHYLAVDATNVYFATVHSNGGDSVDGGFINACPLTGCLDAPAVLGGGGDPYAIATTPQAVFWTDDASKSVTRCTLPDCGTGAAPTSSGGTYGIAADATDVYFAKLVEGTIERCSINGCNGATTVVGSGINYPWYVALDDQYVYYTGFDGTIGKCAKTGCSSPTTLASHIDGPTYIAVYGNAVYWTADLNGGKLQSCALPDCTGGPTTLANIPAAYGLAVDGSGIYVTSLAGTVYRCAVPDCAGGPTPVATDQDWPIGIALDHDHVYWTDGNIMVGGAIKKIKKPSAFLQ